MSVVPFRNNQTPPDRKTIRRILRDPSLADEKADLFRRREIARNVLVATYREGASIANAMKPIQDLQSSWFPSADDDQEDNDSEPPKSDFQLFYEAHLPHHAERVAAVIAASQETNALQQALERNPLIDAYPESSMFVRSVEAQAGFDLIAEEFLALVILRQRESVQQLLEESYPHHIRGVDFLVMDSVKANYDILCDIAIEIKNSNNATIQDIARECLRDACPNLFAGLPDHIPVNMKMVDRAIAHIRETGADLKNDVYCLVPITGTTWRNVHEAVAEAEKLVTSNDHDGFTWMGIEGDVFRLAS